MRTLEDPKASEAILGFFGEYLNLERLDYLERQDRFCVDERYYRRCHAD